MLLGGRASRGAAVQPAETEMAMGEEWAHPELLAQGCCLAIGDFCLLHVRSVPARGDLAKEAKRIGLAPAFLVLAGELARMLGGLGGVIDEAGQEGRLPQTRV